MSGVECPKCGRDAEKVHAADCPFNYKNRPTIRVGDEVWVRGTVVAVDGNNACVNVKTVRAAQYGIDIQVPLADIEPK